MLALQKIIPWYRAGRSELPVFLTLHLSNLCIPCLVSVLVNSGEETNVIHDNYVAKIVNL